MNYEQCIRLTMLAISEVLQNGYYYTNTDNLNRQHIELTKDGLFLVEESRFDNEYTYGHEKTPISPFFLIQRLFRIDEMTNSSDITKIVQDITETGYKNAISYVEIVDLIDKMRQQRDKDEGANTVDLSYAKLKQKLNSVKKDEGFSLKNQVLGLANLSYDSITNIRLENPALARKMERMYQLEKLLRESCYKELAYQGKIDLSAQDFTNLDYGIITEEMYNKVDFSKHQVTWGMFVDSVEQSNDIEADEIDNRWRSERGNTYNPKITVLGLDSIVLPSHPRINTTKH